MRDELAEYGCRFVRHGRGDLASPHAPTPFTVPVEIDSRHTANKVLKDAGLPKALNDGA